MDSTEHKNLTDVIRGVHKKLRKAVISSSDPDKVWNEHLKDYELRKNYSQCMLKLATEIWKGKESRIEWTYQTCLNYFFNGELERSLIRQMRIEKAKSLKETCNPLQSKKCSFETVDLENVDLSNYKKFNQILKLLDVGSCYNPFSKFKEFECTAVDLTPATEDVLQCDFLSVEIASKTQTSTVLVPPIFAEEEYDIVVFSLVLEYLPSSKQRALFCYKAWQLLQEHGLCIIITPDSKCVNKNSHMMKSWKLAMKKLGFLRVKYEKLQHIHCMAFRKVKTETCDWKSVSELLYIPQDFVFHIDSEETIIERTEEENSQICNIFSELPNEEAF